MASKIRSSKEKSDASSIDTNSGSLAYNRLDMQVSQTLHMAIELFPNLDYLFILDYYDDICMFDNESSPTTVSYYQMKTNEESITISTVIAESWLAKLYTQLKRSDWIVQELGLVTNCPLKVTVNIKSVDGKRRREEKTYKSEKTKFLSFNPLVIERIKKDIAAKTGVLLDDVNLSQFVHMRTTLSIPKHREIVEQEMNEFLYKLYPRISIDAAKTIFSAMMDLLTRRQEYELLGNEAEFPIVRAKKGISKSDFSRVIEDAMLISIPPFNEILSSASFIDSEKYAASYEYTKILSDLQSKSESFTSLFLKIRQLCLEQSKDDSETVQEYCNRIYNLFPIKNPIYNQMYIYVLIICFIINEWRRSL